MSVLSFPRIYFKGYMEWDPCTFNNNDWAKFPTYDPTNAALHWKYLATQGITPHNFPSEFRPWAIRLQHDHDPPAGPRVPAEWNMFGSHSVEFVQYPGQNLTSIITGGDLLYGQPSVGDPIYNMPVVISGDGGSGPGRLVDTNPTSPWSSQIYFGQFQFASSPYTTTGSRVYRMHSRWLYPNRIYSTDQFLTSPASSIGVCFQTCFPNNQITWPTNSGSALINALKTAASQPGALGIMIRFTGYVNLYFMNGIFNDTSATPRNYEELAAALSTAWNAWYTNGSTKEFFSNPCYSHIVGVIGVWNEGELASVPGGRCLNADVAVAPLSPTATTSNAAPLPVLVTGHELKRAAIATAGDPVPLGPAAVNVDYINNLISVDFSGVIPELGVPGAWPSDLTKADFGPLTLGVVADGKLTTITTIPYSQYQQSAYEAKAGIIDIPFQSSTLGPLLKSGSIVILAQGQTALLEQPYTAETDTRGIYLNKNEKVGFDVTVCQVGRPTAGVKLLVAKYDSGLNLIPSTADQYVNFSNGTQTTVPIPGSSGVSNVSIYTTNQNGIATVDITSQAPGFPVLAFFPFAGGTLPQPPASFNFTNDAFYTTVRVLPFDDTVPQAFCDLWNGNNNPQEAWKFIYENILYVYDMLFNVMLEYVNLGNLTDVEANLCGIWNAIAAEAFPESTYAMPITRDLSSGKRLTLQLWIYLAYNNYSIGGPLKVSSIPPGWTPCGKKSAFGSTTKY